MCMYAYKKKYGELQREREREREREGDKKFSSLFVSLRILDVHLTLSTSPSLPRSLHLYAVF